MIDTTSIVDIKSLNARIDIDAMEKKIKSLAAPVVKISSDDLIEGKDVLEQTQCNICFEICVKPSEC